MKCRRSDETTEFTDRNVMFCEQLLRKANERKAAIIEGRGDPWVTRQQLRELYQQLLVTDLEFALDKKVEQDLWNHAFKNQISALQRKSKDKTNPKRSEVQAMLTLFLDSGSGFYLQLLQELCSSFRLDIPCCVRAPRLGLSANHIVPVLTHPGQHKVATPAYTSILYICQHCLVHLGDLARYRNETNQSESYYLQAAHLVSSNGQPYNQLAIVAASNADQLAMTFYYIRSIAVKHPFPAAATNLQTTFSKLVDRDEVKLFKMKEVELIHFFIKFHAIVYLAVGDQDLQIAATIKDKLEENFRSHLLLETLTAQQLVQIASINLFALHCVDLRQQESTAATSNTAPIEATATEGGVVDAVKGGEVQEGCYAADEARSWSLVFGLTITLLQLMLHYTPSKSDGKPLHWCALPAVRVILDWVVYQPSLFQDPIMSAKSVLWGKLARVLNSLQPDVSMTTAPKHNRTPLPEDISLNGFLPLQESHESLEFTAINQQPLHEDIQCQERARRLIAHGKLVSDKYTNHLRMESPSEGAITFTSQTSEDQSRRQHHAKQKQPKVTVTHQQQQQQHGKHQAIVNTQAVGQRGAVSQKGVVGKKVREGPPVLSKMAADSSVELVVVERVGGAAAVSGAHKGGDRTADNKKHSVAIQAILPRPNQAKTLDAKPANPIPIPTNNRSTESKETNATAHGRHQSHHSPVHSPGSSGSGGLNVGFRPLGAGPPMRHHPPWPNHHQHHHQQQQHRSPSPYGHLGLQHPPHTSGHHAPPYHPPQRSPLPVTHQPGLRPHLSQSIRHQGPGPQTHPANLSSGPVPPPPPHSLPPPQPQQQQSSGMPLPQSSQPNFQGAMMRPRPGYPHGDPSWRQKPPSIQESNSRYDFPNQQQSPVSSHPLNHWSQRPPTSPDGVPQSWSGSGNQLPGQPRGSQMMGRHKHVAVGREADQQPFLQPSPEHLLQAVQEHQEMQQQQQQQHVPKMDSFQRPAPEVLEHLKSFPPPSSSGPSSGPSSTSQPQQDLTMESLQMAQQLMSQNALNQNILELLSTLRKQMQPAMGDGPAGLINDGSATLLQEAIHGGPGGNSLDPQLPFSQASSQPNQNPGTTDQHPPRILGSSPNKEAFLNKQQQQHSPALQQPFQNQFGRSFDLADTSSPAFSEEHAPYSSPKHVSYQQCSPEHSYTRKMNDLQIKEPIGPYLSSPNQQQQQQQQLHINDWSIDDGSDGRGTPTSPLLLFPTNEEVSNLTKMAGPSTWPDKFAVQTEFPSQLSAPREEYLSHQRGGKDLPILLSPDSSSCSLGLSRTPTAQGTFQNTNYLAAETFASTPQQPAGNQRYDHGGSSLFSDSTSTSERKSSLEDCTLSSPAGYSLFSYSSSPWAGAKPEGHNLTPSPFSSSPSSPRSQSPQGGTVAGQMTTKNLGGFGGGGLGWARSRGTWSNQARGHRLSSSPTSGLLPDSIQSIWSSPLGSSAHKPSPLDELLKRQQMTDQR